MYCQFLVRGEQGCELVISCDQTCIYVESRLDLLKIFPGLAISSQLNTENTYSTVLGALLSNSGEHAVCSSIFPFELLQYFARLILRPSNILAYLRICEVLIDGIAVNVLRDPTGALQTLSQSHNEIKTRSSDIWVLLMLAEYFGCQDVVMCCLSKAHNLLCPTQCRCNTDIKPALPSSCVDVLFQNFAARASELVAQLTNNLKRYFSTHPTAREDEDLMLPEEKYCGRDPYRATQSPGSVMEFDSSEEIIPRLPPTPIPGFPVAALLGSSSPLSASTAAAATPPPNVATTPISPGSASLSDLSRFGRYVKSPRPGSGSWSRSFTSLPLPPELPMTPQSSYIVRELFSGGDAINRVKPQPTLPYASSDRPAPLGNFENSDVESRHADDEQMLQYRTKVMARIKQVRRSKKLEERNLNSRNEMKRSRLRSVELAASMRRTKSAAPPAHKLNGDSKATPLPKDHMIIDVDTCFSPSEGQIRALTRIKRFKESVSDITRETSLTSKSIPTPTFPFRGSGIVSSGSVSYHTGEVHSTEPTSLTYYRPTSLQTADKSRMLSTPEQNQMQNVSKRNQAKTSTNREPEELMNEVAEVEQLIDRLLFSPDKNVSSLPTTISRARGRMEDSVGVGDSQRKVETYGVCRIDSSSTLQITVHQVRLLQSLNALGGVHPYVTLRSGAFSATTTPLKVQDNIGPAAVFEFNHSVVTTSDELLNAENRLKVFVLTRNVSVQDEVLMIGGADISDVVGVPSETKKHILIKLFDPEDSSASPIGELMLGIEAID